MTLFFLAIGLVVGAGFGIIGTMMCCALRDPFAGDVDE